MAKERVLLGMSGGVDSTGAVLLLQQMGYEVVGANLRLHTVGGEVCGSSADGEEAARAAEKLGIAFCAPDYRAAFSQYVMDDFVSEYRGGRTPNPCIRCNRFVKFPSLAEQADALGCRYIATGHYARVQYDEETGRWQLLRGLDRGKDQSYVLYPLGQEILSRLLLPLGMYEKPQIRDMARRAYLSNADKADSQDICFVPDGDYMAFLQSYGGVVPQPGDFVDREGVVLGRHRGLEAYTKGQRRGLGVSSSHPLYVVDKAVGNNRILLGEESELYTRELTAGEFQWVSIACPDGEIAVTAKTRYSQKEALATAIPLEDGRVLVRFEMPQRAVTEGQSVVLYQGDLVVGGGIICEVA